MTKDTGRHPPRGTRFTHLLLGECEMVRARGEIWVVRSVQSGIEYRIPPTHQARLKPIGSDESARPNLKVDRREKPAAAPPSSAAQPLPAATISSSPHITSGTRFSHVLLDECELVRIEGSTWVVKVAKSGIEYRIPPGRRKEFRVTGECSADDTALPAVISPQPLVRISRRDVNPPPLPRSPQTDVPVAETPDTAPEHPSPAKTEQDTAPMLSASLPQPVNLLDEDPRILRRVIMSLKSGLSPPTQYLDGFAVANAGLMQDSTAFLGNVTKSGGDAVLVRGGYGQGKTFSLQTIERLALDRGFCVARTEVDASEIRLDHPHNIYRSLIGNFRIPGHEDGGALLLGEQLRRFVQTNRPSINRTAIHQWLTEQVQCQPLVWLLSDPQFTGKPGLMALLAGSPGPVGQRRMEHCYGAQARDWPAFSAGTQGDFAAYLLSGLGRLTHLMGYQGLILLFDEMEKWQDLSWQQQTKAGNLLGGLIWAATARPGQRHCRGNLAFAQRNREFRFQFACGHGRELEHSARCNGYPFSTYEPCHLGIVVALTPRGADGPEHQWTRYGDLSTVELPAFDTQALQNYFHHLVPIYRRAHNLGELPPSDVLQQAMSHWRNADDRTARSAVTSIITALDDWRTPEGDSCW